MPYATRQSTIDFPKRKSIIKTTTQDKNDNDVLKTPESKIKIPSTPSSSARKAFHTSVSVTGRKKELQKLTDFLLTHLYDQTSGSIYVSGLPGTGKTASVNFVIERHELNKKYQTVKINCTAFNSSKAVFKRICEELKLKNVKKTEKESISAIEKYLVRKHKMILLILDEIDQLESKSQSVLYKIFEWASWENSRFVLVGIANAMDLTDRNLPRLCAKIELKPILLHFAPYTKDEITEILKSRLTEAGADKIFAPGAIELISAKVAGSSGDIRRALDLGKRVIEIAEQRSLNSLVNSTNSSSKTESNESNPQRLLKRKMEESPSKKSSKLESLVDEIVGSSEAFCASPQKIRKRETSARICLGEITPQKSNVSSAVVTPDSKKKSSRRLLSSIDENDVENSPELAKLDCKPMKSPVKALKEEVVLRRSPRKLQFDVDSKDVITVVKNVFGSSKNFKPSEESSFPLHQKLLICTLLLIMKKGKKKDLNVGRLHQVYSKICSKRGLTAVDKSGFLFLCRQVEVTGILQIGKGPGALAKVTLQWDESEVANSLKDLNMMSSILSDTACLS